MNIILLSGGSGKRLWPLSNDIRSKQFIKIFKKEDGSYESMLQRIFHQIQNADKDANITIATAKSQVSTIHNQIGDTVGICVEPCRRDTFPAIILAASYLHDIQGISENEPVVVCPVDPYVEEDYFEALKCLSDIAKEKVTNLCLLGIEPDYPSEKYGYIIPDNIFDNTFNHLFSDMSYNTSSDIFSSHGNISRISKVLTFKEKPDLSLAETYIKQGALWNGGVFACRIEYLLKKAYELTGYMDYQNLYDKYETLDKISFDYAVVEKESDILVMRFAGQWKDLGTWNTLTENMEDSVVGNARMDKTCQNVHIINELDVPILCMGLENAVISASPEGILVSDKKYSSYIKPYVDEIKQQVMFAEKSWGSYQVLDVGEKSVTIKIILKQGHQMSYHSHEHRDEVWTVISGSGKTIVDGMQQTVAVGDVITMQAGCRHTVIAESELEIIEVQLGKEISVYDKRKYKYRE